MHVCFYNAEILLSPCQKQTGQLNKPAKLSQQKMHLVAQLVGGSDPRLGYVYVDKLDPKLLEDLRETHLAELDDYDPRWIGMHPRLSFIYMTALTEQIAQTRRLYPVTDEALDHLAVTGCTVERLADALLGNVGFSGPVPTANEIETELAMISFQSVLPKNIAAVPTEKIIKLRDHYAAELAQFQAHIHAFVSSKEELKQIADITALRDRLEVEYNKQLAPELRKLEEQLRWADIETVTGVMNVSFDIPKAETSAAALFGITILNPLVAAGGAVALAVLKIIGDKRKKNKKALETSPMAYLLRVEKELKPRELLSWFPNPARKFHFLD